MDLDKHKKVVLVTDSEHGMESILKEVTTIQPENRLTIQCDGPVISNPYGDIMRSIILAIFQENVEEILVIGTNDKRPRTVNVRDQFESMKDKLLTLDYLFKNCMPEFSGGTVDDWLNGKENGRETVEKSVDLIRHHPLVPSHVKVRGLIVNNKDEKFSIEEVPTNKTV